MRCFTLQPHYFRMGKPIGCAWTNRPKHGAKQTAEISLALLQLSAAPGTRPGFRHDIRQLAKATPPAYRVRPGR